jgi:serine/threonine protein phosphatase PrpC
MTTLTSTPSSPTVTLGSQDAVALGALIASETTLRASDIRPPSVLPDDLYAVSLPAQGNPIQACFASDAGVGRTHNEDTLLSRPDLGLFAVADGMGGFNAGEVASHLVINTVEARLSKSALNLDKKSYESLVLSAVNEANACVLRTSARRPECLGMGTTLTLLWKTPLGVLFAHVGDSRLYRILGGQMTRLTRDHVIEIMPEVLRGRLNDVDGHPHSGDWR